MKVVEVEVGKTISDRDLRQDEVWGGSGCIGRRGATNNKKEIKSRMDAYRDRSRLQFKAKLACKRGGGDGWMGNRDGRRRRELIRGLPVYV